MTKVPLRMKMNIHNFFLSLLLLIRCILFLFLFDERWGVFYQSCVKICNHFQLSFSVWLE